MRCGISATKVHVHVVEGDEEVHNHEDEHQHEHEHDHEHPHEHEHDHNHKHERHEHHHEHLHAEHRGLREIVKIISGSSLSDEVKRDAIKIFRRLGAAEAAVHNVPVEEIHFHEVGALDAIADIVGAVAGFYRLGINEIYFSKLFVGGGEVRAGHGILPVPAPATARLLSGFEYVPGPIQRELLTPTGAAILTTLGKQAFPEGFSASAIGYGAGGFQHPERPNVIRLFVGESIPKDEADSVWVLETNIDDASPEVCGYAIEQLLAKGALDAFATPIQMKKSRPAWLLSAIVEEAQIQAVEEVFFKETTTFGVRRYRAERAKLAREWKPAQTIWGEVRIKVGRRNGKIITAAPEYEDCRRIAEEKGVPLREVYLAAQRNFGQNQ